MPNVLVTTKCNKQCKYCFARDKVATGYQQSDNSDKEISVKNLQIILKYYKKSNLKQIGLIGGEPTLHSKFRMLLNLLMAYDIKVHIFSNATWDEDYNRLFNSITPNKLSFLLNINSPAETNPDEWNRIIKNLEALKQRPAVSLGLNIYHEAFDYHYIVDMALRFGFKFIRWSLTNPIIGMCGNAYVEPENANKYSKKILNFIELCNLHGINTFSDCAVPLCMFSGDQLNLMLKYTAKKILKNNCRSGPIDIGPDLKIWKCFAFSGLNNKILTDFDSIKQIHAYYTGKMDNYIQSYYTMDKCRDCEFRLKNICNGGCLAHLYIRNEKVIKEAVFSNINGSRL